MCEIAPPHLYGSELKITSSTMGSSNVSSISLMYEPATTIGVTVGDHRELVAAAR